MNSLRTRIAVFYAALIVVVIALGAVAIDFALRSVLIDRPHGLYTQAWAPRRQRYGTVNADGFGVGWYAPGDPDPARYRR